jgi:hypothetical protein
MSVDNGKPLMRAPTKNGQRKDEEMDKNEKKKDIDQLSYLFDFISFYFVSLSNSLIIRDPNHFRNKIN